MDNPRARRTSSLALLGALLLAAAAYLSLPYGLGGAPKTEPGRTFAGAAYHASDQASAKAPDALEPGSCSGCHGGAPHGRRRGTRAFLNLHVRALDCGVCHLAGPELGFQRAPGGQGKIFAARRMDGQGKTVIAAGGGVDFRRTGPACVDCHRRGSALLAGLYDDYRRRLLEELSVLYRLRGTL